MVIYVYGNGIHKSPPSACADTAMLNLSFCNSFAAILKIQLSAVKSVTASYASLFATSILTVYVPAFFGASSSLFPNSS